MKGIVLGVLVIFLLLGVACADPYAAATYWSLESGYRLEFVVCADELRGFDGWGLNTTALTDLAFPPDWQGGADDRKTEWYSPLPQYDIQPGGILIGCAATIEEEPGPISYFVSLTGSGYGTYYGMLIPTPIPEPSSLLALIAGIGGLAGSVARRRRAEIWD